MLKYIILFGFGALFIQVNSHCKDPRCGPNERYEEKPSSICEPMYCSELGFPIDCSTENFECSCHEKPECVCIDGYVRNYDNVCVPKWECPSCGGDPNAVAGCGVNCGQTCADYGKNVSCIQVCYPNACDCREDFLYDDIIQKCVKLEDCSSRPDQGGSSTLSCTDVNITDVRERLDIGTIRLSGEFIYQLTQSKPNENFACSATSVLTPLGQITPFSRDLVLKQLLDLQNLDTSNEIKCIYPSLIEDYKNQENVEFENANRYFFNYRYKLSNEFQQFSLKYFDAEGENVDFSQKETAAKIINDYVKNRTRGRIEDLVSPDALDAATVVVMVNAIYYLGDWLHQFNPNDTQKREFTKLDNSVVQLDTMYQEKSFNYAEDDELKIQALEMPYKNRNFTFFVILPQEGHFTEVVNTLRNPDVYRGIYSKLSYQKVRVYLPKMLITSNLDLGEMLKKANASEMFNPDSNGFTGVLEENIPLYISSAVQKVFIKVDETGTEAAAATAIIVGATSAMFPPPKIFIFNANRPFIFYLLFKSAPLFSGVFVGAQ